MPALTNEPLFEGEPILAVAAVDEVTAADAIERIVVDLEPLPFVVDPLESLRPGGANARLDGNVLGARAGRRSRCAAPSSDDQVDRPRTSPQAGEGQLPMGKATEEWTYGDLDAGFKNAALVLDETFVVQSTSHQPMETRSAMAYWQNGKLYLHGSTQSTQRTRRRHRELGRHRAVRRRVHLRVHGRRLRQQGHAARCRWRFRRSSSRKANAPVMMRISREEEHYIGHARTNMTGRARVGFRADGRITALDLFIVQDNGAYGQRGDHRSAGAADVAHLPAGGDALARDQRRDEHADATLPAIAGRDAGHRHRRAGDHEGAPSSSASIRSRSARINSPEGKAPYGPAACRTAGAAYVTSAFVKEALDRAPRASTGTSAWRVRASVSGIEGSRRRRRRRHAQLGIGWPRRADDDSA